MTLDIVGPYRTGVDRLELHDPVTETYWHLERRRDEWRFAGPSRQWSACFPKREAIARCKEAIEAARKGPATEETTPAAKRGGNKPTAEDRAYWDHVAALGCAVADEHCAGRVEIHHVRLEPGEPRKHRQVIGLCSAHHRTGGHGVAFHAGRDAWEERYGHIADALSAVRYSVAEMARLEAEA